MVGEIVIKNNLNLIDSEKRGYDDMISKPAEM